jgi:hypothetical protein
MRALLTAVALLLAGGCAVPVTILGAGPLAADDPMILDYALLAVRNEGYRPIELDPNAGRFEVESRSGRARFVVQCFADGWISIVPVGPGIDREGDRFSMSRSLRDEYGHLAAAIDDAMEGAR